MNEIRRLIVRNWFWLILGSTTSLILFVCIYYLIFGKESLLLIYSSRLRRIESCHRQALETANEFGPLSLFQSTRETGFHTLLHRVKDKDLFVQIDLRKSQWVDSVVLVAAVIPGEALQPYGFPELFRIEIARDAQSWRTIFERTRRLIHKEGSLVVPIEVEAEARYIRITASEDVPEQKLRFFALGECLVLRGNRNIAAGALVTSSDTIENPPNWSEAYLTDGRSILGVPVMNERSTTNGFHSDIALKENEVKWLQIDLEKECPIEEIRLVPAQPQDFPNGDGFGFPKRFRVLASSSPDFEQYQIVQDQTESDFSNPGNNPVVCCAQDSLRARFIRIQATKLWARTRDYVFALAELQVYSAGENVALNKKVEASDSIQRGLWRNDYLVDGFTSNRRLTEWPEYISSIDRWIKNRLTIFELEQERTREETSSLHQIAYGTGTMILASFLVFVIYLWRMRRKKKQEMESLRQQIACDLHDEIGSNLGGIALLSQVAQLEQPKEGADPLKEIERIARKTADSMRDIVWLLSIGDHDNTEFVTRFRETAATLLCGMPYSISIDESALPKTVSLNFKRHIYLAFKEALHNIIKHAAASQVTISLVRKDKQIVLLIEDNGKGFEYSNNHTGTGLASIASRAASLHGRFTIDSAIDHGCRIQLILPYLGH